MNNIRKRKVAILAAGSLFDRKGVMNAVHNRAKHLQKIADFDLDIYLISIHYPWYIRIFTHKRNIKNESKIVIDGVKYQIWWKSFSIIDYILRIKLRKKPLFWQNFKDRCINKLKNYDLIDCHSFQSADIALTLFQKYGNPYIVTWHGSDIHSVPRHNAYVKNRTKNIIENASCNLFVSQDLLNKSYYITKEGVKRVLYNGVDNRFHKYNERHRKQLRDAWQIDHKKIVVFCGNLIPIKNVTVIPDIFNIIHKKIPNVFFWVIGDGEYKEWMQKETDGLPIKYWGNQQPEFMPDFMNASDVLILPSKNEGLPLVTIEALACGCHVVGSRVGGIPEAIGNENTIPLNNDNFTEVFANKVIYFLDEGEETPQPLADIFDWEKISKEELNIIQTIISNNIGKRN